MALIKPILLLLCIAYLGVAAALFLLQRSFMYHPDTKRFTPMEAGLPHFTAITADRRLPGRLSWWLAPPDDHAPVILYFHGNAGALAYYAYEINDMASWGAGVLAVGYPGYGGNDGRPSEGAMSAAAEANYRWLINEGVSPDRIVIYGHSLGSGVASRLAAEYDAAGLILSAPFTSMAAMAQKQVPFLPAALMTRDRYDTLGRIAHIGMPLVWLHGARDDLIPESMGRQVFMRAKSLKSEHVIPEASHNNLWARGAGALVRKHAFTLTAMTPSDQP